MTFIKYETANNVSSYLVSAISSNSTSVIVNDGWIFPSSFPYMITIEQQLNGQTVTREIAKVTARSGNTLTIERAVEYCVGDDTANPKTLSKVAHSFEANSVVALTMTAWTLLDAQNWITDNADAITSTNNDISDLSERIDNIEEDISLLQNL